MQLRVPLLVILLCLSSVVSAQKFTAEKGQISFFSDAPIEDIEAVNTVVGSLYNAATGEMVYILKIRDFIFPKALMREHFNEKYMESEKFPKSTFQGKVEGYTPGASGIQKVKAVGKLSIHGITRDVQVPGTMENVNGKLLLKSRFSLKLADYDIKIPTIVWQNIAEEVEVRIDFTYKPL
jgi:hypothetical protein